MYSRRPGGDVDHAVLILAGTVREVSGDDAPVAVRVPASQTFHAPAGSPTAGLRTLDGALYRQNFNYGSDRSPLTPDSPDLTCLDTSYGLHSSVTEARETLREALAAIILIDGYFWTRIPEPALVLDRHGMSITIRHPHSCSPWRVYSLAEGEEAVEAARRLRRENGMTAMPEHSALNHGVELLMPEVITMPSNADRMEAVRAAAAAKASAAFELLNDLTPRNLHEASRVLAQAADDLNAQTTGSTWNGGNE